MRCLECGALDDGWVDDPDPDDTSDDYDPRDDYYEPQPERPEPKRRRDRLRQWLLFRWYTIDRVVQSTLDPDYNECPF